MNSVGHPVATEICVVGGGPAGCAAARRLGELGHDVALVWRREPQALPRAESLPPGIAPLLDSLRLADVLDEVPHRRETQAWVAWGAEGLRLKPLEPAHWLVLRTDFDHHLRRQLPSPQVRLLEGNVRRLQRAGDTGWRLTVEGSGGLFTVEAAMVVDARGRRHRAALPPAGPRTVALTAQWCAPPGRWSETRVESGAEEWFWGCPLPQQRYAVTVFVDASAAAGLNGEARAALHRQRLARSRLLAPLSQAEALAGVQVRDATPLCAASPLEPGLVRVGDAACAIDPVASQGVQRAVVSAIQAAAVVHTVRMGADPEPAFAFYADRVAQGAAAAAAQAARFAAEAHRHAGGTFWAARAVQAAGAAAAPPAAAGTPAAPARAPALLRLCGQARLVQVPVLDGAVIRYGTALAHPRLERPVAFWEGRPLAPLARALQQAASLEQAFQRLAGQLPPEPALRLLRWLQAQGLLVG